jgi:hypothetical protein
MKSDSYSRTGPKIVPEAVRKEVEAGIGAAPIGAIIAWPARYESMPIEMRARWKKCSDGATAEYTPELWNALKGLYGNGAGPDSPKRIKLPNLESRFLMGAGGSIKPGVSGGKETHGHSVSASVAKPIITGSSGSGNARKNGMEQLAVLDTDEQELTYSSHSHTASASARSASSLPPFRVMVFVIRVK